jgi:hypothetical protein
MLVHHLLFGPSSIPLLMVMVKTPSSPLHMVVVREGCILRAVRSSLPQQPLAHHLLFGPSSIPLLMVMVKTPSSPLHMVVVREGCILRAVRSSVPQQPGRRGQACPSGPCIEGRRRTIGQCIKGWRRTRGPWPMQQGRATLQCSCVKGM